MESYLDVCERHPNHISNMQLRRRVTPKLRAQPHQLKSLIYNWFARLSKLRIMLFMHKYNDIRDVSQLARTVYEYELMPLDELFSVLLAGYQTYATGDDTDLRKAFELGKKFHDGQLRKS